MKNASIKLSNSLRGSFLSFKKREEEKGKETKENEKHIVSKKLFYFVLSALCSPH